MKNKGFHYYWSTVLGILIFIGFSIPATVVEVPRTIKPFLERLLSDPLIHVYSFFLFALLLGLESQKHRTHNPSYVQIGFISSGYALFIEIYQIILPYRGFEIKDVLFGLLGIIFSIGLLILISKLKSHLKTKQDAVINE